MGQYINFTTIINKPHTINQFKETYRKVQMVNKSIVKAEFFIFDIIFCKRPPMNITVYKKYRCIFGLIYYLLINIKYNNLKKNK